MPNTEKLKVLHIVRRYAPVGGMENYVWKTTQELYKLGHTVEILCETCHSQTPAGIKVYTLGTTYPRPRWLALLIFSIKVNKWLKSKLPEQWLVHSHERLNCHHVTTFHSPPFMTILEKPWWKRISIRVLAQLFLEKRELKTAQIIVPNSNLIKKKLNNYYPSEAEKITSPVIPGVEATENLSIKEVINTNNQKIIGFVGKEWKRKGLVFAVKIMKKLHESNPNAKLHVFGPQISEIEHLFKDGPNNYELKGWGKQIPYASFDLLLHPAQAEPYGMVITEAMSVGVPVVISDQCGAADNVNSESGAVLSLADSLDPWVQAVEKQLNRRDIPPKFERTWLEVAKEYEQLYLYLSKPSTT